MSNVRLKVFISKTEQVKTLQFELLDTIGDVISTVQQKVPNVGGSDHGIFLPGDDGAAGKWLKEEKTIQFYDLKMNDTVEYRKKHALIKIKLLDESQKSIMADFSLPVADIVVQIADKYNVNNPEEYGLKGVDSADQDWLNGDSSLHEQGVDEGDVVLFKKRFYYSDHNIDKSDPVQLHLTYSQAVLQILNDEHPTTQEEAINFAALQMQIQYGNHNPQKHKSGFIKLKDFVPKKWQKTKNVEKRIYNEHKKLVGLSEINSKFRYLQLMRNLKTFGVTQFFVKEPIKGSKKKFNNIIIGITRDALLRLDPNTREVLDQYPLTTLKRWAAQGGSKMVFDFGEYRSEYYEVMTTEGDAMSSLIAGYIDIILQRRGREGKKKSNLDDDEMIAEEETVMPSGGHAITTSAGSSAYAGQSAEYVGPSKSGVVSMSGGMQGQVAQGSMGSVAQVAASSSTASSSGAQQAASAWRAIAQSSDLERSVRTVTSLGSDIGSFIPGSGQRDLDQSFDQITKAAGDLAASASGENAARMEAAAQVLSKWKVGCNPQTAQAQLNASAKAVAAATTSLVGQATSANPDSAVLLASCQAVAAATAQLVAACKGAAAATKGVDNTVMIQAADALAGATAQLVAACQAQVAAAAMGQDPTAAKAQLVAAAKAIGGATTQLLAAAARSFETMGASGGRASQSNAAAEKLAKDLLEAGKLVMEQFQQLLNTAAAISESTDDEGKDVITKACTEGATSGVELVEALKRITDLVVSDEAGEEHQIELTNAAKGVSKSTTGVVASIKATAAQAGTLDAGLAQQLAASAKAVAEQISNLCALAGDVGTTGTSTTEKLRTEFQASLAVIEEVADSIVEFGIAPQSVLGHAKQIAAASTKMVNVARQTGNDTNNEHLKNELLDLAQALADQTATMVRAVKAVATQGSTDTNEYAAAHGELKETVAELGQAAKQLLGAVDHADLVEAAKTYATTHTQLISSAKNAAGTASADSQKALVGAAKPAALAMTDMVSASKAYEVQSILNGCANAAETSEALVQACVAVSNTTSDASARQLLLQAVDNAVEAMRVLSELADEINTNTSLTEAELTEIYDLAKTMGTDIMSLVYAANQNESEFVSAARQAAQNASLLSGAISQASTKVSDDTMREALMDAARALAGVLQDLVVAGQEVLADPEDTEAMEDMAEIAKMGGNSVLTILDNIRDAFPESSPNLNDESAMAAILAATEAGSSTEQCPSEIAHAAQKLTRAVCQSVLDSRKGQTVMVEHAREVSAAAKNLMSQANELAEALSDQILSQQLTDATQSITAANTAFINNIRGNLKDPVANERFNVGAQALANAAAEVVVAASIAAGDPTPDADVQKKMRAVAMAVEYMREAVASGVQSQIVEASKGLAEACTALNGSCAKLAGNTKSSELQEALLAVAKSVMAATAGIIQSLKGDLSSEEGQAAAQAAIDNLDAVLDELLTKTSECTNDILDHEANNIDDPVERELQAAARNIDAMMASLSEIQQKAKTVETKFTLEEKKLAEEIVECAKSIAGATGQLMRAAKDSQHELNALHKAAPNASTYLQDPSLKEGLVGAAKSVAGAIDLLVNSANEQAMGTACEEKLIACAKGVTSSTADLVYASRAKCKAGSANQQKLDTAAKQVAATTQEMVKTAKAAREAHPAEVEEVETAKYKNSQVAEMEAQMEVLRLEKQLEEARKKQLNMRKAKYANAGKAQAQAQAQSGGSSSSGSSSSGASAQPAKQFVPQVQQESSSSGGGGGGGGDGCGECGCTNFEAHPFKTHQCRNCFHTH